MSDGSIKFDTKVDTSGVKQGKKEIDRELSGLAKISNKIKEALKFNKRDTKIELNYSAQKPQSFFEDNIRDEEYAIKSINEELGLARKRLAELHNMQKSGNYEGIHTAISQTTSQVKVLEEALLKSKSSLEDNKGWLAERIEIDKTTSKVNELQAKMDRMNATGVNPTSASYKNLNYDLLKAKAKLDSLMYSTNTSGTFVSRLGAQFKTLAANIKQNGKLATNTFGKQVPKAMKRSSSSIRYFGKMLASMFVMSTIFGLMRTFTVGMQDMARVCPDVNSNLSKIMSSLKYLKNSFLAAFSPLLQIVLPVINTICNALSKLMNYISMLFSYMAGKNTYKVAIKQQKDFAKSLDKSGTSAKKTNKALASFDEINQLNLNKDSGSGLGKTDIDSNTFEDKQLPKDGKIAKIWEHISNLMKAAEPLINNIVGLCLFLYNNALVPIGNWAVDQAIPSFFNVLASAMGVLNSVLEALKPLGIWLWDEFLEPAAQWVGDAIIDGLESLATGLDKVSNWINENQELVQLFAIIIGSLAIAWGLINAALFIWNTIVTIATVLTTAFGAAIAFLTSPIGLVMLAIAALIAILVLLVKHWDKVKEFALNCWDGIVNTFNSACEWFDTNVVTPLSELFKGFVNGILGFFESMANGIIGIFESIVNFFVEAINSIGFDMPSFLGGGHVGFNLSPISLGRVSLPRLATGTVVPPNVGEFAAILGDNKRETEIVSPLSTMKQALAEVLAEYGADVHLEVNGNLAALIRLLKIELAKEDKRKGKKLVIA